MEDKANKTEKATPRKRQRARDEEGKVATSKEIYAVVVLVAGTLTLFLIIGQAGEALMNYCRIVLGGLDRMVVDERGLWYREALPTFAYFLVPVSLAGTISVLGAGFSQTRGLLTFKVLGLKIERLNPVPKIKQMFASKQAAITLAQAVGKVAVISGLTIHIFWQEIKVVVSIGSLAPIEILTHLGGAVVRLGARVVLLLIVFAVIDYVLARRRLDKDLRMSKREVKEEHRQYEGDPEIKRQLYRRRMEMSRNRMMAEVPKADVVLVNPTHFAVALRYSAAEMGAPQVTAKGKDFVAGKIRELARESSVPVIHNPPLTRAIFAQSKIGDEVPSALFSAVAEVLAHVYKLKGNAWMSNRSRRRLS